MKQTAIILTLCIMTSISSFGTPYYVSAKGKITVDTISFQFFEKDIENPANYIYK